MKIHIRKARKKNLPSVLELINELAVFENARREVKVTVKELQRDGFGKKKLFECFVAEGFSPIPSKGEGADGNKIVGIALYYIKYSTWKGRCIYLDDLIVTKSMRRAGIGKKLFEEVVEVAKKMPALRGLASGGKVRKLEWQVLDWNKPAIAFYKKYSTVFDNEWVTCKLVFEK